MTADPAQEQHDIDIPCEAVLFDCDGVLVDSVDSGERSWRQWSGEYGLDPALVLDGVHGRRSAETVALFLPPDLHRDALARIDAIEIGQAVDTRPIAGARQLLGQLVHPWAVVTSASAPLLAARLTAASLPTPPVLITAGEVRLGKPDPEGYLLAADKLGVPIQDCVIVEDSATGIRAAAAATPYRIIGVGEAAKDSAADLVVRDLTGITSTSTGLRVQAAALSRA
ncbi:sugar-phosphatase [Nocardia tenerifensis]|uniref:Sugar-phosphatase n=1 Tax=Nocardia tenerifensis TaxID=228006 RepID=A0A318JST8_9NOCA|nr:HAD-IA family hydrolase [Nocardia tenerifensis]PXX55625.1 sugar-phosphatase [Nocardia tenerifensis]